MVYNYHQTKQSQGFIPSVATKQIVGYIPQGANSISYRNDLVVQVLETIAQYALNTPRKTLPRLEVFQGGTFVFSAGSSDSNGSCTTWIDPLQRITQTYATAQRAANGALGLDSLRNKHDYGSVLSKESVRLLLGKRLPSSQARLYATLDALFCRPKGSKLGIWTNERIYTNTLFTVVVDEPINGIETIVLEKAKRLPEVLNELAQNVESAARKLADKYESLVHQRRRELQ